MKHQWAFAVALRHVGTIVWVVGLVTAVVGAAGPKR